MEILKKYNSNSYIAFFVALLLFFRCLPYFLWSIEDISRITCSILIPLLCLQYLDFNKKNIIVFSLFSISFLLVGILRGSDFFRVINLVFLAFIPILKKDFAFKVYRYFKSILSFILFFSIIVYFIVLLTGWKSSSIIEPVNTLKIYKYFQYPFLVMPTNFTTDLGNLRFHSIFDEPGVVGTFCGLILCIEKFKLKGWQNIVILIAGILSFSFYFFILLLLVPIYSLNGKYRFFVILFFVLIYFLTYSNSTLFNLIWFRFSWDPNTGSLPSAYRGEGEIKEILEATRFSRSYFFGSGYEAAKEYMGGASIYLIVYREGFLFVALNIIAYIVSAFYKLFDKKVDLILFILILIGTLYQRPGFFDVVYIFLFTTLINKYAISANHFVVKMEENNKFSVS